MQNGTDHWRLGSRAERTEAVIAAAYFLCYFAFLFFVLENEMLHWGSMVLLPLILAWLYRAAKNMPRPFLSAWVSLGFAKTDLKRGWIVALAIGLALASLQFFLSSKKDDWLPLLLSKDALLLLPMALLLLMLTAGFTEEFLFRGYLQGRLSRSMHPVLALCIAAFAFGIYHLPYAYLHPRWPSHGDFWHAVALSLGQGIPGGLILGWLYNRYRNLPACMLVHAMIDMFPALPIIKAMLDGTARN